MDNNNNDAFKALQTSKRIHHEIQKLAAWHDVPMKELTSALLRCMLEKHPEECKEIIEVIKKKS